ncbi:MAG: cob(I)yrinic acid a,c-diamide adenosyltransferase [Planctomycetota bacterium]|nr:cob(I)yrinic acid a,c-diamide adenosyltransferase [Planctomycetota bacterium]
MPEKARVILITGDGKGKTTAALGMVMRSLAHRRQVLLARFCKTGPSGELVILQRLGGTRIISSECGRPPAREDPDFSRHAEAAQQLWEDVLELLPVPDLLVLDEVCLAVGRGLLDEAEVLAGLEKLRPNQVAILTGRQASLGLIARADTVSDCLNLKHAFARGRSAEPGIEF